MTFSPQKLFARAKKCNGFALVLVLAFVVLLTGIALAFLSDSLLQRQVSNSSAGQVGSSLLADGAVDVITGDLQSEIAAGSTNPPVTVATGGVTTKLYIPTSSTGAAYSTNAGPYPTMLPATQGFTRPAGTGTNGLENLVKVSSSGQPFFAGGAFTGIGPTRAAASSTNAGDRPIQPKRWNKPLFLQPTSADNLTPHTTTPFPVPDWIYVANDGTNPTQPGTSIVGRYAYAIYDEGGLLDINVAGYPAGGVTASDASYKNAEAYADLTVSPISLTTAQINEIVSWRNQATITAPQGYQTYVAGNTTGFLRTGNTNLAGSISDRMFVGRQQLIDFLTNKLAPGDTTVMGALQYLTTFTRDLNEPSFIRLHSTTATGSPATPATWDFNATVPHVLTDTSGGNNAAGLDDQINPSFLAVRTQTAITRNDGAPAAAGEALVRRFALNRLAWLTCKGPSASRNMTDSDMAELINNGISASYLALGTPERIKSYFGLVWDTTNHYWTYVHNGSGSGSGPIMRLREVSLTAGREPDFFELLKATVNVGAIGKALTLHSLTTTSTADQAQANRDYSVDYAIIQLGANIIDQFDADGYPTRIEFNDGSGAAREFAGVENLPYIYRVRNGLIKIAASQRSDSTPGYTTNRSAAAAGITVNNTGVGALVQYVDLWNPHDYTPASLNRTMGTNGPTAFRVYATSTLSPLSVVANGGGVSSSSNYTGGLSTADRNQSPGFQTIYHFPWTGESRSLNSNNTEMTFSIPRTAVGAALFREPTILFQPNMPTGSNLASTPISKKDSSLGVLSSNPSFFGAGGISSAVASDDGTGLPALGGNGYIGFYIGAQPLIYMSGGREYAAQQTEISGSPMLTYTLQCQDAYGAWVTYDEKSAVWSGGTNDVIMGGASNQFLLQWGAGPNFGITLDPRTSRFGMLNGYSPAQAYFFAPFHKVFVVDPTRSGFMNQAQGVVLTQRDGYCGGGLAPTFGAISSQATWCPLPSMGWYTGYPCDTPHNGSEPLCRLSLIEQNDANYRSERAISDQTGWGGDGVPPRGGSTGATQAVYYADPDNVVRRAAGAYNTNTTNCSNMPNQAAMLSGSFAYLPLATANNFTTGTSLSRTDGSSGRPVVLNRPFRSVGELGYVFSGTPWKNVDFSLPESGYTGLLDAFCVNDSDDPAGLVAGKINLNTRQQGVLTAILNGAYKDERFALGDTLHPSLTSTFAGQVALALRTRTTSVAAHQGPLTNPAELVGQFIAPKTVAAAAPGGGDPSSALYGTASYGGFSADLIGALPSGVDRQVQRFREASIRALSAVGQTRVWNLMIDVIAQTGKFPNGTTDFGKFSIAGERRLWVHVAIDRFTGKVIDKHVEVVTE